MDFEFGYLRASRYPDCELNALENCGICAVREVRSFVGCEVKKEFTVGDGPYPIYSIFLRFYGRVEDGCFEEIHERASNVIIGYVGNQLGEDGGTGGISSQRKEQVSCPSRACWAGSQGAF